MNHSPTAGNRDEGRSQTDSHRPEDNDQLDHPYTAVQALAASMINTGLRPDAALHRAQSMQAELLAMGYELTAIELVR